MKNIRQVKNRWMKVGDYYCKDRAVMSPNCIHVDEFKKGRKLYESESKGMCLGSGLISGFSPEKGSPVHNKYWKPNVVGSWCWNREHSYCSCDCSMYTDEKSCNSGVLNLDDSMGTPYCWGCNWS